MQRPAREVVGSIEMSQRIAREVCIRRAAVFRRVVHAAWRVDTEIAVGKRQW